MSDKSENLRDKDIQSIVTDTALRGTAQPRCLARQGLKTDHQLGKDCVTGISGQSSLVELWKCRPEPRGLKTAKKCGQ